jgi:chromosome segregation ATPase
VSQGSIDQVIMASPAERKDYFDEAVGVKEFQLKRDQSINKLENAGIICARLMRY